MASPPAARHGRGCEVTGDERRVATVKNRGRITRRARKNRRKNMNYSTHRFEAPMRRREDGIKRKLTAVRWRAVSLVFCARERRRKKKARMNAKRVKGCPAPPIYLRRRRSWARDFPRTIPVTDGD